MHILLVEDNAADAFLLKELLSEKSNPPAIEWVTDGDNALAYVKAAPPYQDAPRPNLILLDLGLPRISGYEVLKTLKQHMQDASIPVIVLTTSRNPVDRTQCIELGANAFISKPHNLQEYEELADHLSSAGSTGY